MVRDFCLTMNTFFKVKRSITCRDDMGERISMASVELTGNVVTCILDYSEYYFTAQQCGELANNLAMLLQAFEKRKSNEVGLNCQFNLDYCKIFYHMILSRTLSIQRDLLEFYDDGTSGMDFGATGSFCYPILDGGEPNYYDLFLGVDDERSLPCLGVEDRVFVLSFEEVSWLIEQLCVGGYLLAQLERPREEKFATVWITVDGQLTLEKPQ